MSTWATNENRGAQTRPTFGKYLLLRRLASGGMGEVFLAKQRGPSGFEKLLVIKRILAHHLDKRDYLDMFFSEAKLVARLHHGNIVQIHEMGEIDGDYYIAMEYVRGKSLRDLVDAVRKKGALLPLSYVVELGLELADALAYAHDARDIRGRALNIVHRDINPHNILVSYTGDLKLIDFGIAKSEMTSIQTTTGTIKGKFVYMSPEQSAADPLDRRSDIFSMGIVLYELACLENPFVRQNVVLSLEAIQRQEVPLPSSKRRDGKPLDAILTRALAKKAEERYQSAGQMRDELRQLLVGSDVPPVRETLSSFLEDLFAKDISAEDRLLLEADHAVSEPPDAGGARRVADGRVRMPTAFTEDEPTLTESPEAFLERSRQKKTGVPEETAAEHSSERRDSGLLHTLDPPTRSDRRPGVGVTHAQRPARRERLGNLSGLVVPQGSESKDSPAVHVDEMDTEVGLSPADGQRPNPIIYAKSTPQESKVIYRDESRVPWEPARIAVFLLIVLVMGAVGFFTTRAVVGVREVRRIIPAAPQKHRLPGHQLDPAPRPKPKEGPRSSGSSQ